jgi:hypothetical protein
MLVKILIFIFSFFIIHQLFLSEFSLVEGLKSKKKKKKTKTTTTKTATTKTANINDIIKKMKKECDEKIQKIREECEEE